MDEQAKMEETVDHIKEYINTRYELTTLKALDKTAQIFSGVLSKMLIIGIAVVSVLLFSLSLACYLNTILLSSYLGFVIVGSGYALISLILYTIRKKYIIKPFRNQLVKELFKKQNL